MVLGGSDHSLYEGQISYVDLNKPADYYGVPVVVGVGDQPNLVCNGECTAVIDTGTSFMVGPLSKISVICKSINGGIVSWYFII